MSPGGPEAVRSSRAGGERLAERMSTVEAENNRLANLYVASCQLHSSLDLSEVLRNIVEIMINLIGADQFAVYILDEKTGRLEPVVSHGMGQRACPAGVLGERILGRAVQLRETFRRDPPESADASGPLACVPLHVRERPLGAIVVHRLFEQKKVLNALDEELFALLADHAAAAILAAQVYGECERKLNTIQGFLDLLTK